MKDSAMVKSIKVITPGTHVVVGVDEGIPATIQAATIRRDGSISYLCCWWSGRTRNKGSFAEEEIGKVDDDAKIKIGFKLHN